MRRARIAALAFCVLTVLVVVVRWQSAPADSAVVAERPGESTSPESAPPEDVALVAETSVASVESSRAHAADAPEPEAAPANEAQTVAANVRLRGVVVFADGAATSTAASSTTRSRPVAIA